MISLPKLTLPQLTPTRLILLTVVFLVLTGNWAFYDKLTDVYPLSVGNVMFLFSLSIFHFGFLLFIASLFWLVLPARIVASLLILIAACVGYFADQLGIVIDADMIRNTLLTNPSEMIDLVNIGFVTRLVILGIVPVVLVWRVPYAASSILRELRYKAQTVIVAAVVMVLCIIISGNHYASFFHEHKSVRYYMNPVSSIYAVVEYTKELIIASEDHEYTTLAGQAEISEIDTEKDHPNTHDALFSTLLDLFEVKTDLSSPGEFPLVYLKADH